MAEKGGLGIIRSRPSETFHHALGFYESDDVLMQEVVAFLDMEGPRAAIVVATRSHLEALERHLSFSASAKRSERRCMTFEAETLLHSLMVDNFPDEARFRDVVGQLLRAAGSGPVKIFGEMVALLWERGDVGSALKLEKLWNRIAEDYRFDLLCAYPTSVLHGSATLETYQRMCATHSHLVPFKG